MDRDVWDYMWPRLLWTAGFTPVFYLGFGALGVPIIWPLAVLLAAVLVFGGWLVIAWADDV